MAASKQFKLKLVSDIPQAYIDKYVPRDGYPITQKNKEKIIWVCQCCNSPFSCSFDNLTNIPDPDSPPERCPICRIAQRFCARFVQSQHAANWEILSHEEDGTNEPDAKGRAPTYLLRHLACGKSKCIKHSSIKALLAPSQSVTGTSLLDCEFCAAKAAEYEAEQLKLESGRIAAELEALSREVWGQRASVRPSSENGQFHITVNAVEGERLDRIAYTNVIMPMGRLKGPLNDVMSEAQLRSLIKDDLRTKEMVAEVAEDASNFGAVLKYVAYQGRENQLYKGSGDFDGLPAKSEVYFCYTKATGHLSNWQSYHRLKETNYTLTTQKRSQLLTLVVLKHMFPADASGEVFEWRQDVRGLMDTFDQGLIGREIDIVSEPILLPNGQYTQIWAEYQGVQSHNDCEETKKIDRLKKEACSAAGQPLLVVSKMKVLSAKQAILVCKKALAGWGSNHPELADQLRPLYRSPNIADVGDDFRNADLIQTQELTSRLHKVMADNGRSLVNGQEGRLFLQTDTIKFICHRCGKESETSVKNMLSLESRKIEGCEKCRGITTQVRAATAREEKYQQFLSPELRARIHPDVLKQLSLGTIKENICCPRCDNISETPSTFTRVIERLEAESGFICGYCLTRIEPNTPRISPGNFISEQNVLTSARQWQRPIREIIKLVGWCEPDHWYQFVRRDTGNTKSSNLHLELTCEYGHVQIDSLEGWRRRTEAIEIGHHRSACRVCSSETQTRVEFKAQVSRDSRIERLRAIHPQLKMISASDNELTVNCGQISQIGRFQIPHPDFLVYETKINNYLEQHAKHGRCRCLICAAAEGGKLPDTEKNLASLDARLKLRAAWVADFLGHSSIDSALAYASTDVPPTVKIKSGEKIYFQCHNPEHKPVFTGAGNFFNPKRLGYCPTCMKDVKTKLKFDGVSQEPKTWESFCPRL
ncbi:hypothetical protein [Photobacterium kishitanii]|uniref:hypothetical protein n=1 Tax=Photobacterium kishitanii TaxID=318456 RepID=UPI0007F8D10C|nr:hypothetical protein [Photobacterium kishitanii]OBU33870.1 hypothetical protein AYY23_13640 [Photobacterium kishitanii]PSW47136.1 hypothetical protein C0W66_19780 [Photobacterium kishitanii]